MLRSIAAILVGCAICFCSSALPAQTGFVSDAWKTPDARQFDFWLGSWDVNLRMIQADQTWKDSVKAKAEIYSILDGKAILELWDSPTIKGFSLRYYDPDKQKWVLFLNWPSNSRSSIGSLEGEFRHGRGEFFTRNEKADGSHSISRYTFCDITDKSLRWDDAFSKDGGKTWTNNWIMEFTRSAPIAEWPSITTDAHTFEHGGRCQGPGFDAINSMAGRWTGEIEIQSEDSPTTVPARLSIYKILDGCSVIRFLEFEYNDKIYRSFGLLTYQSSKQQFAELGLDNRARSKASVLEGSLNNGSLTLESKRPATGKKLIKNIWTLPTAENDKIRLSSSTSMDRKNWTSSVGSFRKIDPPTEESLQTDDEKMSPPNHESVINSVCPRSGKPVSSDSLTTYRGQTVGFCNTHCRDDFAANFSDRPQDRKFFDQIIDSK